MHHREKNALTDRQNALLAPKGDSFHHYGHNSEASFKTALPIEKESYDPPGPISDAGELNGHFRH